LIEPVDSLTDRCHGGTVRHGRPLEHEYRYTERPGCRNLAVRGVPAAVLGDDRVDGVRLQQCAIRRLGKRPARQNVGCMRDVERRIYGINTSDEVVMLWSTTERTQLLAPDCEESSSRAAAQCTHGTLGACDVNPKITVDCLPRRPTQGKQRSTRLCGSQRRVRGNHFRVRMRGIYQEVYFVGTQIVRKARGAPESADPHGSGLSGRGSGPPSQRDGCGKRPPGEGRGQLTRLGGASQDQDVWLHGR